MRKMVEEKRQQRAAKEGEVIGLGPRKEGGLEPRRGGLGQFVDMAIASTIIVGKCRCEHGVVCTCNMCDHYGGGVCDHGEGCVTMGRGM